MRRSIRRGYAAAVLVIASIALLAITMVSPAVSTTVDFSIYNSGWNGTSDLAVSAYRTGKLSPSMTLSTTGNDITIVQLALDEIAPDPNSDSLVIIGPTRPFTEAEGALVGAFVRGGGFLLLADDFGTGNSLLDRMGATSRFSGKLLMDLAFEKKPEFCVCFNFDDDPVTEGIGTLLMNYPSSVVVDEGTTTGFAWSSPASWLDADGDRLQDLDEPRGPFALLARESLGNGSILLVADPSILINGMRQQLDNGLLADNLLSEVGALRTAVYFDESHRDYFDPLVVTSQFTGGISATAKFGFVVVGFVLLVWISTNVLDRAVARLARLSQSLWTLIIRIFAPGRSEPEKTESKEADYLVAELVKLHPDWKPGLVRYVLREKARHVRPVGRKSR